MEVLAEGQPHTFQRCALVMMEAGLVLGSNCVCFGAPKNATTAKRQTGGGWWRAAEVLWEPAHGIQGEDLDSFCLEKPRGESHCSLPLPEVQLWERWGKAALRGSESEDGWL